MMSFHNPIFRRTFRIDSIPTSVKFSPFSENLLACTSAENFGLYGKGYVQILELTDTENIKLVTIAKWGECLLDVTWSESNPELIITSSGDGTLQLWNLNQCVDPISIYSGHHKDVYSVQWNQTRSGQNFISSSWDSTVKFWDVSKPSPLLTLGPHQDKVYDAVWSPLISRCFASVSGDGILRVWDLNEASSLKFSIPAHGSEILCCDWNKYNQFFLVTGGTDSLIRGWDLRWIKEPCWELRNHQYAVRRVKFSPRRQNILVSCSYDFTTRIWNLAEKERCNCSVVEHHSEFVYGLDISVQGVEKIVDCGWDKLIHVFI